MRLNSPSAIKRAAQQVVEQHARARSGPLVLWAGLDEPPQRFAVRVKRMATNWTGRVLAAIPHGYATPTDVQRVEFPPKLFALLHPSAHSRYRCASGGRGSAKSHSFARAVILNAVSRRMRVLCCREIMRSLRESVHHLLVDTIDALGLAAFFDVTDREITCTITGSEIIFTGLWANITTLKSLENIALVWIEESESVSAPSLQVLAPTIRAPESELWLSCNPDSADAPVMQFCEEGKRDDVRHVHVTYLDNPWFPPALEGERAYLQGADDDAYRWVWLGECRTISDAQIFKNKFTIEEFTPAADWAGPWHGLDLGFSADPSVLTKCWVHENRLYIEREAWGLHVDIDRLPALLDQVPDARKYTIRVDSSRPETVSYLKAHGYPNVVSVDKWPDSVQDGVARMRAFERIVLHPSCEHTAQEFRLYSYKVDRLTGDVLPDIIDKFNHCVDSIRYGIAPMIKPGGPTAFLQFISGQLAEQRKTAATPQQPALAKRPGAVVRDL
jgi:phage terminase large subunit